MRFIADCLRNGHYKVFLTVACLFNIVAAVRAQSSAGAGNATPEIIPQETHSTNQSLELVTRTFESDPQILVAAMKQWAETNAVAAPHTRSRPILIDGISLNTKVNFVTKTNTQPTLNDQLRAYLASFGV